jgi:hypothetical protein
MKEQIDEVAAVAKVGKELATLLDGTMTKHNRYSFTIDIGGGKGVHVNFDREPKKYRVGLEWPMIDHRQYMPDEPPHISVSRSRGIEALANDIRKRLMSGYDEAFAAQIERGNEELRQRNAKRETMIELNTRIGNRHEMREDALCGQRILGGHYGIYELFNVAEDGQSVQIKTHSLPIDIARQVIDLLKKIHPHD